MPDAIEAWVRDYYATLDAGDVDGAVGFFNPEAVLTFANQEPNRGTASIAERFGRGFETFEGFRHAVKDVWVVEEGVVAVELDVTYIHKDGREVTVPGSLFGRVEADRWLDQRIYVDLAPAFAGI